MKWIVVTLWFDGDAAEWSAAYSDLLIPGEKASNSHWIEGLVDWLLVLVLPFFSCRTAVNYLAHTMKVKVSLN